MIALSLSLMLAPVQDASNLAADFFFLKSGVSRYYTSTSDGRDFETIDEVGTMELIGSETVIPISTRFGKTVGQKSYYAARPDGVYLVADWELKAVNPPIPVLKVSDTETKWSWKSGDMSFTYTSKPGKTRNVFGKDVPTIEYRAIGGDGNDDFSTNVDQTAIYAKGVGMLEMTEVSSTKKSKSTRKVKLTKISGGGW